MNNCSPVNFRSLNFRCNLAFSPPLLGSLRSFLFFFPSVLACVLVAFFIALIALRFFVSVFRYCGVFIDRPRVTFSSWVCLVSALHFHASSLVRCVLLTKTRLFHTGDERTLPTKIVTNCKHALEKKKNKSVRLVRWKIRRCQQNVRSRDIKQLRKTRPWERAKSKRSAESTKEPWYINDGNLPARPFLFTFFSY